MFVAHTQGGEPKLSDKDAVLLLLLVVDFGSWAHCELS